MESNEYEDSSQTLQAEQNDANHSINRIVMKTEEFDKDEEIRLLKETIESLGMRAT